MLLHLFLLFFFYMKTSQELEADDLKRIEAEIQEGGRKFWLNLATVYQTRLGQIPNDEDSPPAAIVSASKEVFDRAFGKVAEKVELQGDVTLNLNLERKV